jgi:hypothetical protein
MQYQLLRTSNCGCGWVNEHGELVVYYWYGLTEVLFVCFLWRCGPKRAMASSFLRFLVHTQRRITVGRTPLDEWSARRRDLYLTTHNTHNRQTSMTPVGFEPAISASERPQTYALDRAATGTGDIDITFPVSKYVLYKQIVSFTHAFCNLPSYNSFSIYLRDLRFCSLLC